MKLDPFLQYPIVLFDLGSTLIYFSGDWSEVIQQGQAALVQALQRAGLALDSDSFLAQLQADMDEYFSHRDEELIEHTTGAILRSVLSRWGYTNLPDSLLADALQAMYQVSERYWQSETETLPALDELRRQGCRLGLISNAADDANVQHLVDQVALRPYFDVILTSAAHGIRKPHPQIFQTALATWNAAPTQAVMVGDTLSADIAGAQNLGIYSVWVTRRASSPDSKPITIWPDAIIENVGELPEFLASLQ